MTTFGIRTLFCSACIAMVAIALLVGVSASASPIDWTTWSSDTTGTTSHLGLTVTYSGEMTLGLSHTPTWGPRSTFTGGTVGNPPLQSQGGIAEEGTVPDMIDTVTFSKPVLNPVMALWSLGAPNTEARFDFETGSDNFTIQSGGPNAEFGGSSIVLCADDSTAVCGHEGNGTIQFNGTFSSISWTQPEFENFYVWTVGAPVPEPNTLLLLGSAGLGLAGYVRRKFRRG